ncbi:MAG: hypothetical protein DRP52_04410 [Planctomycetota bacterium]|nr:MAG: hypothetical protein DRP52_04410 [Planctomycetota bacterium]
MNADQVINKILTEAQQQADEISRKASDNSALQKRQTEEELADYRAKTDQLAAEAGEDKLRRMLANARMGNAKQLLAAKVEILDDVFGRAKKAVNDLPDEDYLSWAMAMMKQAVESGDEEVIVGKDEKRIDSEFIKKVNRELGTGFKGNLILSSEKGSFSGGFILSRGKVQINATTDVMIDALRESMEIELSQGLFGSE